MHTERRERIVEALLQIRPGEVRLTALLFLHSLCVVGSFIVARSVRDALFLAHGTREGLPQMYIASALAVALVGVAYARVADRLRRDWLTSTSAALSGLGFAAARLALPHSGDWIYGAVYVFVEVVGALTVIQFWTLANDLFNPRDARRLFGTIGAGGTLANILLGGAVGVLARKVGAENLLLLSGALLGGVAGLAMLLGRRVPVRVGRARTARAPRPGASRVFASPHLKTVAALAAVTFLATTLVDFQFKTIVSRAYSKDALASFFGVFYAATGVLALFVQFFGTSRLLSRFGVVVALSILPACLGLGSVAMLLWPALLAATFAKGSEFVFRYTVNDATSQLLFMPIAASTRAGAKAFIDGVVKPAAIAASGLLLLGYKSWAPGRLAPVAIASALACAAWALVVLRLRTHYVRSLQETLRSRRLDLDTARHHIAETANAAVLLRALESTDAREVLNALELLPHTSVARTEVSVARLLENPDPAVRAAAAAHLGRSGSLQVVHPLARLFEDPEPAVRAAGIEAYCAIVGDKAVRRIAPYLRDPSPPIRGAAVASFIRHGGLDGVLAAAEALKSLVADPDPRMREQAARVLGAIGVRNFYGPVLQLMNDADPAVRRAAIDAAGGLRAPELATALVYKLARPDSAHDAGEALARFGPAAEALLERVLANAGEAPEIRRHAPRVLGRIGSPRAVAILTAHLTERDGAVRRAVYTALGRALRRSTGAGLDRRAVQRAIDHELACAYHALACAEALGLGAPTAEVRSGAAAAEALLASALAEKVQQAESRLFTLVGILHPEADVELIYAGLRDASARDASRRRANALELLDTVLASGLRRRLFPLLEDLPRAARLRAAAEHFPIAPADPAARLRDLLGDDSAWVRACALHLAGERGAPGLERAVLDNLDHPSPVVREACVAALQKTLPARALAEALEGRQDDDAAPVRERVRAALAAAGEARAAG